MFLCLTLRVLLATNSTANACVHQDGMVENVKHLAAKVDMGKTAKEGKPSFAIHHYQKTYRFVYLFPDRANRGYTLIRLCAKISTKLLN